MIYDNEYQMYHGGQQFNNAVDNGTFDGYVIMMQSQVSFGGGHYAYLKEIIDYMVEYNKLDPFKVITNGLSAVDAILAEGGNYTNTMYPTLGHGVWNTAWDEPDFWPYVNRYYKSDPWPLFGRTEFCPGETYNVTLALMTGFNNYEWRKMEF
ncbi:MAG: hypothetical protein IPL53_21170 [Ignavibacteria bacterium]|nr:hypothetical protein [Ignavibacteria bacterium]